MTIRLYKESNDCSIWVRCGRKIHFRKLFSRHWHDDEQEFGIPKKEKKQTLI